MSLILPPLWPAALPLFPDAGPDLSGGPQDQLSRFQPQRGLPMTRPDGTAEVSQYQVGFAGLTAAQMDTFRTFRVQTLRRGALRFGWVHPQRRVVREVAMAEGAPVEVQSGGLRWTLRFAVVLVDVQPWWAAHVTIAGGILEQVSSP